MPLVGPSRQTWTIRQAFGEPLEENLTSPLEVMPGPAAYLLHRPSPVRDTLAAACAGQIRVDGTVHTGEVKACSSAGLTKLIAVDSCPLDSISKPVKNTLRGALSDGQSVRESIVRWSSGRRRRMTQKICEKRPR